MTILLYDTLAFALYLVHLWPSDEEAGCLLNVAI